MKRHTTELPSRSSIAVFALAIVLGTGMIGGCDTITSDFAALQEDLFPPTPVEAATSMFDPYDPEKRRRGTALISNSPFGGAEPYVKAYADRIDATHVDRERNPIVLAALLRALARHGEREHAPLIAEYLDHPSQQVQWEAAKGLQRIHNTQVVPDILAVVRDERTDRDVRIAALRALGQYPEDRVFQALISDAALNARELAVNLAAQESLRTLTGQDFGLDATAWLRWYHRNEAPFAERGEYLYPTYSRDRTLFEWIAFWSQKTWETPRQPAGLRPEGRETYDDAATGSAQATEDSGRG